MFYRLVVAVSMIGTVTPALADADNGGRLAQRWCASCHVVARGQTSATGEAPPFSAIARRPDFDATKVAYFLLVPHPKMPDMALSRTEASDLAAYIATQK